MPRFQPLNRRTFLRGAGASLALPLLDATAPPALAAAGAAAGAAAKPPVRLAWLFIPNGVNVDRWRPTGKGEFWWLSPTMQPLAELKRELTAFSGLAHSNARALGDGPGDHARSAATFLTGVHPLKTNGAVQCGVSADQVAAHQLGAHTALASLELGVDAGPGLGICDSGYACAYSNNISWRSPTQPSAKEVNPRLAFERLFGGAAAKRDDGPANERAARERIALRRSILDLVADQTGRLERRLGRDDRRKLDEYFHSIRDVERRIDRHAELKSRVRGVDGVRPPTARPADPGEHIRLMADLMVLAFRTDATRVATFMLANEGSSRLYPMVGVHDGHHQVSHHKNQQEQLAKIARIDRYLIEQYAYLLRRMRDTPEGDGTLLDNSLVLYGGAISDGNRHSHHDLPVLVGGRGGGAFTPDRHVVAPKDTPLCNLYLAMFDAAGVEAERFGDSTGRVPRHG